MIILSYDFESTGTDKVKDRIIEAGFVLYSTGQDRIIESTGFLVDREGVPVTAEMTEIHGVTQIAVDTFGYPQEEIVNSFIEYSKHADMLMTHNGTRFDYPMLEAVAKRVGKPLPPVKSAADTMVDIPGVKGEKLVTMLAQVGVVMPFQHGAEDDSKGTLILGIKHSQREPAQRSWEKIKERADCPLVVLQSHQRRDRNADAKVFGFRWNDPLHGWFRIAKEMDVQHIADNAPFDFSRCDKDIWPVWDN